MELAMIIIGALSAIASTVVGVKNINAQKDANLQNVDLQQQVNQQNINEQWKMWNATNLYNTPASQMERYKSAGLNPNLIYGQSNTTNAANVGTSVSPKVNPIDFSQFSQSLPQLLSFLSQSNQVRRNRFQNKVDEGTAGSLAISNEIAEALKTTNIDKGKRELDLIESQLKKVNQDILNGKSQKALHDIETLAKQLNYDYDKQLYDNGFPPDIDPNQRAIASILAQILGKITNLNPADVLRHYYGFNDSPLKFNNN